MEARPDVLVIGEMDCIDELRHAAPDIDWAKPEGLTTPLITKAMPEAPVHLFIVGLRDTESFVTQLASKLSVVWLKDCDNNGVRTYCSNNLIPVFNNPLGVIQECKKRLQPPQTDIAVSPLEDEEFPLPPPSKTKGVVALATLAFAIVAVAVVALMV
jgi:hypothetical protein